MLPILENTQARLVAEQSPPATLFFGVISALICGGVAGIAILHRKWVLGLILGALTVLFVFLAIPGSVYRITVDRSAGKVQWVTTKQGRETSSEEVAATDISSAELEFNRDARCIVLILKDGSQVYPLGRQHYSGEPEQYVVLDAIRQLIAQ